MLTFKSQAGDVRIEQHKERIFYGAAVAKQLSRAVALCQETLCRAVSVFIFRSSLKEQKKKPRNAPQPADTLGCSGAVSLGKAVRGL